MPRPGAKKFHEFLAEQIAKQFVAFEPVAELIS
jgi:hypothetical protein